MNRWFHYNRLIGYAVVALLVSACQTSPKKGKLPNVILILVDDLGYKDLGCTGSDYYETPHIDQLAQSGVVFDNAYAPAANCAPSRACIMSGQNTPRHGIYTVGSSERGKAHQRKLIPTPNTTVLADSSYTLAEMLHNGGYRTASIGKWHLGDDACTQGFDINIGGTHVGYPNSYFSPYRNKRLEDGPEGEYLTDRLTDEAISFMRKSLEADSEQPFFLYLPYFTVHTPLQGKSSIIEKYKAKAGSGKQANPVYAAMVEGLDTNIGRLTNAVKDLGIDENTIIIFTSDNGGIAKISSQAPLRAGKGSYYEGGIRVPLIMCWPNEWPHGQVRHEAVTGLDFYPTLSEVIEGGLPSQHALDGESLVGVIKNQSSLSREALYWHFPIYLQAYGGIEDQARDTLFRTRPGTVMRQGKYKLHEYFEDGMLELYDLSQDPGEWHNLSDSLPKLTEKLHLRMKEWRQFNNAPVPTKLNPAYQGN